MSRKKRKAYRIVGAYDSETTNIIDDGRKAFPILHQLALLDAPIETITADNVESHTNVHLYRHTIELYEKLDELVNADHDYVPVICCHNLSFDMYGLSQWLDMYDDVKVLAKSARKPIAFTIRIDGEPRLVIWDTLIFTQKSLRVMGDECGYEKLVGSWDYDKTRTPDTALTDEEISYATHDVYALLAYMGYWCKLNPDIKPEYLACRVLTKTGIVRTRRLQRFGNVKGIKRRKSVSQYWTMLNIQNRFSSDDELFTANAAMRGGFTFVSGVNASRVFDLDDDEKVYGYDATSQHPAQIVSHKYPEGFRLATINELDIAFRIISRKDFDYVLDNWDKPFPVAFYGAFTFENLRLKKGTLFEKWRIIPLASSKVKPYVIVEDFALENQDAEEFKSHISDIGYRDSAINPTFEFGKLKSAERATLFLTELSAFEVCQCYDFDSVKAESGYITMRFGKPSDMAIISVMQFYNAKNEFKHAREMYYKGRAPDNCDKLIELGIARFVVDGMKDRTIDENIVDSTYLQLKADLNSLFGIEASNEYRRDTILTGHGIDYMGDYGICNAPKHPKAFYQMGSRIVGWSRIAQLCIMHLMEPYIETIINGDTDSIKCVCNVENVEKMEHELARYAKALDVAKEKCTERIKRSYPDYYSTLEGIGHYVREFETTKFCASWNKAYVNMSIDARDGKEHARFTIAGIPASRGVNQLADKLISDGMTFDDICNVFLGYNVTYAHDLIKLNARAFPEWGEMYFGDVRDYKGSTSKVCEPASLAIYPMAKTLNDTRASETRDNMSIALRNNPNVNIEPMIISENGIIETRSIL